MTKQDWPATTDVVISASEGIASMKVIIEGGNPGFSSSVKDLNFTGEGRELIGDADLSESLGMAMPAEGDTEYTFPIAGFYLSLIHI